MVKESTSSTASESWRGSQGLRKNQRERKLHFPPWLTACLNSYPLLLKDVNAKMLQMLFQMWVKHHVVLIVRVDVFQKKRRWGKV